eukprot:1063055-Amphidinium_carterae.1
METASRLVGAGMTTVTVVFTNVDYQDRDGITIGGVGLGDRRLANLAMSRATTFDVRAWEQAQL